MPRKRERRDAEHVDDVLSGMKGIRVDPVGRTVRKAIFASDNVI